MPRQKGFTIVELLIVVAIIGVIAAIAIPSYQNYITRAGRTDGQTWLMTVMQAQERFYSQNQAYTANLGGGVGGLALTNPSGGAVATNGSLTSEDGRYTISAAACANAVIANCVTLTATAQGQQAARDTECGNLTLDSRGTKGESGTGNVDACW